MIDVKYLRQNADQTNDVNHSHVHIITTNNENKMIAFDSQVFHIYDSHGVYIRGDISLHEAIDASCSCCCSDDGSLIFIGNPHGNDDNGVVHVYKNESFHQTLNCIDNQKTLFGYSVCCSANGDKLYVGTHITHYLKSNVYKYESNGEGVYVKDANFIIKPPQYGLLTNFGSALFCSKEATCLVVHSDHVSIKNQETNTTEIHGQIQVFTSSSQGWNFTQQLISNMNMNSQIIFNQETNQLAFYCSPFLYVYDYLNNLFCLKQQIKILHPVINLFSHKTMKYFYVEKEGGLIDVYVPATVWEKTPHSIRVESSEILLFHATDNDLLVYAPKYGFRAFKAKYKQWLKKNQETNIVLKHGQERDLHYVSDENKQPTYALKPKCRSCSLEKRKLNTTQHGKTYVDLVFAEDDTHYATTHRVPIQVLHHRHPGNRPYNFLRNFFNKIQR